jgi:hypothetical protein
MAPNRTRRTKPLPRLTSPFLPASILPPTANSKRLRNIEQEYERMMRNEQVVMAKEAAGMLNFVGV